MEFKRNQRSIIERLPDDVIQVTLKQSRSTPGAYVEFDLVENIKYTVYVTGYKKICHGDVRLYISIIGKDPILFSNDYSFRNDTSTISYEFIAPVSTKYMIGLLAINCKMDDVFIINNLIVKNFNADFKKEISLSKIYDDNKFFNNLGIYQIYIDLGLKHLSRIKKLYNLRDYDNINEPALFFGIYDNNDINAIKNHKSDKYIMWGGTDIDPRYNIRTKALKGIKDVNNISHIAISDDIKKRLKDIGIDSYQINLNLVNKELFKPITTFGNKIYIYNGLNPGREHIYGKEIYEYVMQKLPQFEYILSSERNIPYEKMPEVYKECFIALRLTSYDGNANMVQELEAMGINVVHNGNHTNSLAWNTKEDVVKLIENEWKKINKTSIAFIIKHNNVGGTEYVTHQHIKWAKNIGYNPILISAEDGLFYKKSKDLDIDAYNIQISSNNINRIYNIINKCKMIYVCNYYEVFKLIGEYCKKKGINISCVVHLTSDSSIRNVLNNSEYINSVICINDKIKEKLIIKGYPEYKIYVIPNWIECNKIPIKDINIGKIIKNKYGIDDDSFVIGAITRIADDKNITSMINILASLNTYHKFHLLIIGDGDRSKILSIINKRNMSNNVTITGFLDQQSIYEALNSVDICINTSTFEGLPIAMLEQMAMGIHCVYPTIGEIANVMSNYGSLININEREGGTYTKQEEDMFVNEIVDIYKSNKKINSSEIINNIKNIRDVTSILPQFEKCLSDLTNMKHHIINIYNNKSKIDIYVINLDYREDRLRNFMKVFDNNPYFNIYRYDAVKYKPGWIGCGISHLNLIRYAYNNDLPYIIVCEDDIDLLITIDKLYEIILSLITPDQINNWNIFNGSPTFGDISKNFDTYFKKWKTSILDVYEINWGQTTPLTIYNKKSYKKMLEYNFEKEIDQYISKNFIQITYKHHIANQIADVSDIRGVVTNNARKFIAHCDTLLQNTIAIDK